MNIPNSSQAAFLADLHWHEFGIFPAALLRARRMPRRYADYPDAFAGLESGVVSYALSHRCCLLVFFIGVIHAFVRKEKRPQTIRGRGRNDIGVDIVVSASFPPYRDTAEN